MAALSLALILATVGMMPAGETIDWRRGPTLIAAADRPAPIAATPLVHGFATSGRLLTVGLLCPNDTAEASPDAPAAVAVAIYRGFLEDEGYPFSALTTSRLAAVGSARLAESYAAVIIPEGTMLSDRQAAVLDDYVRRRGGRVLAAWDPGATRLWPVFGLAEAGGEAADPRQWLFPSWSPVRAYVDPDSLDGVVYRPYAQDPVTSRRRNVASRGASAVAPDVWEARYPVGGLALFVNGELAAAKRAGDDSLFRGIAKYFLDGRVRLPRVLRAPGGVGGLVLNLHVCSSAYFADLDHLLRDGALSALRLSVHVTPGPDTNKPGDGLGVDAASPAKGRPFVEEMASVAAIGAHGGWIHNLWAAESAGWPWALKRRYLDESLDLLAEITGRPVVEYSAPGGVYDLITDDYLAQRGVIAAVYPSGTNAPPAHTWVEGKRPSRIWHFGYTGTGHGLCPENMLSSGLGPAEVSAEVRLLVERVAASREIRLFYLHPQAIARHPEIWRALVDEVRDRVAAGRLVVDDLGAFAHFLGRVAQVRLMARAKGGSVLIDLEGPESLWGVTVAVPLPDGVQRAEVTAAAGCHLTIDAPSGWAYLTVDEATTRLAATVTPRP